MTRSWYAPHALAGERARVACALITMRASLVAQPGWTIVQHHNPANDRRWKMFHGPNGQPKVKSRAAALLVHQESEDGGAGSMAAEFEERGGAKYGHGRRRAPPAVNDAMRVIEPLVDDVADEASKDAAAETIAEVVSEAIAVLRPSIPLVSLKGMAQGARCSTFPGKLEPADPSDQCERHPQCIRGSRHHGKGGKCSLDRTRPLPQGWQPRPKK
jgi:hypothetical protein